MVQTTLGEGKKWLYDIMDTASNLKVLDLYKEMPKSLTENINQRFELRPYQIEAFARFFYYFDKKGYPDKKYPMHLLFNMATGSGKTLIMAGLILYLYEQGYRNFLFFVNSVNIIEKTKENFLNNLSNKFLFDQKITINNQEVKVNSVDNFEGVNNEDINICFTTIQGLHSMLNTYKENCLTYEDFKDKKIVIISDEAHHINTWTKQDLTGEEAIAKTTWEHTVNKIFILNKENIMLDFTATIDTSEPLINEKYRDKNIFKYDLKQFRNDRYSKDVEILRSDTDKKGRILYALILNQYRQEVAAKNNITLKPVILFKSQKTIAQSEENKEFFHNLIENLSPKDIDNIRSKTDIKEIIRAFEFYDKEGIDTKRLIQILKINFAKNKCISMNDDSALEKNQIIVNNLEDKNNQIRAIFTVQKLNEGWDVLNLFDIVRLYEGQAAGGSTKGRISPTTISEAQLVGRGARYYPFRIKGKEEEKFLRKFDEDLKNELRILEELHFHSWNESRYISELKKALVEKGIIDDKTEPRELKLKDSFKKSDFYKNGLIYLNKRLENDYSDVKSIADLGVKDKDFTYEIISYKGKVTDALKDNGYDNYYVQKESSTIKVNQIEKHIFQNAIARKDFFRFSRLKHHFHDLTSVNEFIQNNKYLGNISIKFVGLAEDICDLSNEYKFRALLNILGEIEDKLRNNFVDYKGSTRFVSSKIKEVFIDKVLRLETGTDGEIEYLKDKEWYAFEANYGTSEEKACVKFIESLIKEDFNKKYQEIYLIRNELHFVIYNFDDGRAFAPDFVLYLKNKSGKELTYQIFVEAKGEHLIEHDKWKEDFLLKIQDVFKTEDMIRFIETTKYKVIGVPFFNQLDENKFKEELLKAIH